MNSTTCSSVMDSGATASCERVERASICFAVDWRFIGGDSFGPSTNFPHPGGGGAPYGAISAYNTEDTSITKNTLHPISMRFGVSGTAANNRREAHKRAREARTKRFADGKGGGTLDPYEPPAPAAAALAQTPRVPPHEQRQDVGVRAHAAPSHAPVQLDALQKPPLALKLAKHAEIGRGIQLGVCFFELLEVLPRQRPRRQPRLGGTNADGHMDGHRMARRRGASLSRS